MSKGVLGYSLLQRAGRLQRGPHGTEARYQSPHHRHTDRGVHIRLGAYRAVSGAEDCSQPRGFRYSMVVMSWAGPALSCPETRCGCDDDGPDKEQKKALQPAEGALASSHFFLPIDRPSPFSFFLSPSTSLSPSLMILSPTSEPTVSDVNVCRSDLKRSKTKHCVILGRVPYGESVFFFFFF